MSEFVEVMKQKRRMCKSFELCKGCPLSKSTEGCSYELTEFPRNAELIIMKWASEHPSKTNADKFKEVFGYEVIKGPHTCSGVKHECHPRGCDYCEIRRFWDKEYIEPNDESGQKL